MRIPMTIVFDLDGTLVDTAPDLLSSLNAVLTRAGHLSVEPAQLRHLVGYGVPTLFERAFAATGTAVHPDLLAKLGAEFLTYYGANIARESRPFSGVRETLDRLAHLGARSGVCTNKPQGLSDLLLKELNLSRHFGAVIGEGSVPYHKPDPRHVLDVVAALDGTPEHAIMIGDSAVDVAAARAARIPVIAMSYGYSPVPAHELGADAVADSFAELPKLISNIAS